MLSVFTSFVGAIRVATAASTGYVQGFTLKLLPSDYFYKELDRNVFQSKLSQTWGYLDNK